MATESGTQEVEVTKGTEVQKAGVLNPFSEFERMFDLFLPREWGGTLSSARPLWNGFLEPFSPTMRPFDQFERALRDWMRPIASEQPVWNGLMETWQAKMPNVDVIDRDGDIVVRAEVPGIDKKDLDVSINDTTLTIKGNASCEAKEEKGEYRRHEISSSAFLRTVPLPVGVDASKEMSATLKDGVLEVTLPKVEAAKRHSIAVH